MKWIPNIVATASIVFACIACSQSNTANQAASDAVKVAEEANRLAEDANRLAAESLAAQERRAERFAAERVTFTAARQADGNYRIAIDNLSIQRMNALQLENRENQNEITAVYLRDQHHCKRSYYIVSGEWWKARSMHLVYNDASGVAWSRSWKGVLEKEGAVNRKLPMNEATYLINKTPKDPIIDQSRQVIGRAEASVGLPHGCA